jgi:hypothetical protein
MPLSLVFIANVKTAWFTRYSDYDDPGFSSLQTYQILQLP